MAYAIARYVYSLNKGWDQTSREVDKDPMRDSIRRVTLLVSRFEAVVSCRVSPGSLPSLCPVYAIAGVVDQEGAGRMDTCQQSEGGKAAPPNMVTVNAGPCVIYRYPLNSDGSWLRHGSILKLLSL
jgi:hypothetical protein